MTRRDTGTGWVLEQMVLPALRRGGYEATTQVYVGQRLGGGRHRVDALAKEASGREILISLKWQQTSGTAEQKVPFEIICLADAIATSQGRFDKAYVVLGGNGWKLRDFYTGGGLQTYLNVKDEVEILNLEAFIAKANQRKL